MIAEGERSLRVIKNTPQGTMHQNNRRSAGTLSRAPLLETFNAWLCSARHAQMLFENRCDLAALQLAHEDGAITDEEVRIKASQLLLETESLRPSRKWLSGADRMDGDAVMWYTVSYSLGASVGGGRLIMSRTNRVASLFFYPKRSEEKVTKYTLAFVSVQCTEEFVFGLLKRARDLSIMTPSFRLKGSQGLLALSVTQAPADRSRADALLRRVIPKQMKVIVHAVETIRRWWVNLRSITGDTPTSVCSSPIPPRDASFTPFSTISTPDSVSAISDSPFGKSRTRTTPVRRRTKSMRIKQKQVTVQKKRKSAAEMIQRAFRSFRLRNEQRVQACIRIQWGYREYRHRVKAARVLQKFLREVVQTARRRHALAMSILETREALYGRISADVIDFYNATHATMVHFYPLYNMIIDQVRDAAFRLNPSATVEPFGSSVTGLALPSSDLDLVIYFQQPGSSSSPCGDYHSGIGEVAGKPQFLPYANHRHRYDYSNHPRPGAGADYDWNANAEEVAHFFCRKLSVEKDWVRSARVVGSATQPVIKLMCHPRSVPQFCMQVDLTMWHPKHTGVQISRLVRDYVLRYHPQVAPLVLVIKQYLRECKLNSVFSGGLSSVSLAVLVWIHSRDYADPLANLGELLLSFLETFGEEGFFARNGVSVKQGVFSLAHLEERQHDFLPPATIEDPLREGNNLAAGMFRVGEVATCFRQALKILADSSDPHPLNGMLRSRHVPVGSFDAYYQQGHAQRGSITTIDSSSS